MTIQDSAPHSDYPHQFLLGGGEMGELTRQKDWSKTPVGPVDQWPQSLRTTLSILLNSRFPMFLFWGPDLICFYNDAYRPSLGNEGKHPGILGARAEDYWQEIWADIKPLIDRVLSGGPPTWSEDQLLPIFRNGKMEDVYWTFSYSPVNDESGKPAGVFVTCSETTEKVITLKRLEESNRRFLGQIMQTPAAMCFFRGKDHIVEVANGLMLELWGKTAEEVINKPIFEGLPEARGQGLEDLLNNVYVTGERFTANEHPVRLPRKDRLQEIYVSFVYEALKEPDGTIPGVVAIAIDVTDQVTARRKVEEREERVRALVRSTPFPMAVYAGKEMRIELANQAIIDIWGKGNDVIGKLFTEVVPELENQLVFEQIKEVFATGTPFHTKNTPLDIIVDNVPGTYYFNYSFTPLYDSAGVIYGVMNTGADVTDTNIARKKVEESEARFRTMAESSQMLISVCNESNDATYFSNAWSVLTGKPMEDLLGIRWAELIHEEDRAAFLKVYLDAFAVQSPFEGEFRILGVGGDYRWLLAKGAPLCHADGSFYGFVSSCMDISEQVGAFRQVEEREQDICNMVLQAPIGICVLDAETLVSEIVNDSFIEVAGKPYEEIAGKYYWDAFAEAREYYEPELKKVVEEGVTFSVSEVELMLIRHGKEEQVFVSFVYAPLKNAEGKVTKIAVWVLDNTPQVTARQKIAESEKRFRDTVKQASIGITILRGPEFIVEMANDVYLQVVDRTMAEFEGRPLFDSLPEVEDTVRALLDSVYSTGAPFHGIEYPVPINRYGKQELSYFDFLYHPLKEDNGEISGIMVTVTDVTDKANARQQVVDAEERLRLATEASELSTFDLDLRTNELIHSPRLAVIFGHDKSKKFTYSDLHWQIHPDDRSTIVEKAFEQSLRTGIYEYEVRFVKPDQTSGWIRTQAKLFYDADNQPLKMVGTVKDITEEKLRRQELLESELKFRLLADSMPQHIWTSDPEGNLNYFNESVYNYSGLTHEQMEAEGWLQIVHPDDREHNISAWMEAVATGQDFLLEHRFRKYDGEYRWQLSRAIPQKDADGKIQMWVGTSTDIHDQRNFVNELEKQVQERTGELAQKNEQLEKMNKELQSFAYISSHDLQEPLRKIQTFSSRIIEKEFENLSDYGKDNFQRMQNAARRMQTLIEDLLAYSRTNTDERKFEYTHLGKVVEEVTTDLEEELQQHRAVIRHGELGAADIIPFQFRQLLYNLISNSLKFSKEGVPPVITIESTSGQGSEFACEELDASKKYCHIRVSDNGIGFDPQYSEKIFEVFQRLHGRNEYHGTGIGLAIVKKIVENHQGAITAGGKPGEGAVFDIYIPEKARLAVDN